MDNPLLKQFVPDQSEKPIVRVAAGIIYQADGRIVFAKRKAHKYEGGCFEFPGGKIETDETPVEALKRELLEEIGIKTKVARFFFRSIYETDKAIIDLNFYEVTEFEGDVHGAEGQAVVSLHLHELDGYYLPEANQPVLTALNLVQQYAITQDENNNSAQQTEEGFYAAVAELAERYEQIQIRRPDLDLQTYNTVYKTSCERHPNKLFVYNRPLSDWLKLFAVEKGLPDWICAIQLNTSVLNADWSENNLHKGLHACLRKSQLPKIGSCHDMDELSKALLMGAEAATVSPVNKTKTHPSADPLAPHQLKKILDHSPIPLYALGGISAAELSKYRDLGFFGVAGMRAF